MKTPKNAKKYECLQCTFICSKESDWNRHLLTSKHKNRTNRTEKTPNLFFLMNICENFVKKIFMVTKNSTDENFVTIKKIFFRFQKFFII